MDYATMNRNDLRAACKAAGISYAKLTVDGMRAALLATETHDEIAAQAAAEDQMMVERYGFAHCPDCNVHLSNGVLEDGDEKGDGSGKLIRIDTKFECMGCGHGFGPATKRRASSAPTGTGLKHEKNRETQNGVTRPSAGGKCRAVWDALDRDVEAGQQPDAKRVKELAEANGWNPNNAMCELYAWRKFNGLSKPRAAA